ncbi:MAG: hypothetical protein PUE08_02400 [Eubacteriales bacterium]|nr:hypothetical protein [Eubacteriales bacterium]
MKYFTQTLLSLVSSAAVILCYDLLSVFWLSNLHTTFISDIITDIVLIVSVLILNFIFGHFFAEKMHKQGFLIQLAVLLLIAVIVIIFEVSVMSYLGIYLNSVYVYTIDLIWQFSVELSFEKSVESAIAVLSAVLPCLSMLLGTKTAKQK